MSVVPVSGWDALVLVVQYTESGWQVRIGAGFVLCASYVAYRAVRWVEAIA